HARPRGLAPRRQPAAAQGKEGLRIAAAGALNMFIGHYAVALAAKRAAPRASLGTLFAATSLADLLWPVFLLLGWEQAHFVPGPHAAAARCLELRRRHGGRRGSDVRRGRLALRHGHASPRPRGELRILGARRGAAAVVRRLAVQSSTADARRARHRRYHLRVAVRAMGGVE